MKNISLLLLTLLPFIAFSQIIYVDSSAVSGLNTGVDWENAFTDLQDALNIASEGDEIWVANGTYFPTESNNREIYFELPSNVALLGGFAGDETQSDQRDWELHQTILSGDIGVLGDSLDNSFTVIYAIDVSSGTRLDGFIIEGGNANSDIPIDPSSGLKKSGGGFYLKGENGLSLMTIENCTFLNNYATYNGGGVYLMSTSNSSVNMIFNNCQFYYNTALLGGGISKYGGGNGNYLNEINSCTFEYNSAVYGGAINILNSYGVNPFLITNSQFSFNSTTLLGGAIWVEHNIHDNSIFKVEGCIFTGNASPSGGTLSLKVGNYNYPIRILSNKFKSNIGKAILISAFAEPDLLIESCSFFNEETAIEGLFNEVNNCLFVSNGRCINIPHYQSSLFSSKINSCTFFHDSDSNGDVLFTQTGKIDVHFNNSILMNIGNGANISVSFVNINNDTTNIFMNNCLVNFDSCLGGVYLSPQNIGTIECNAMIYNHDPLFRDTANLDFSLLACSPAIDAGDNAFVSDLTDFAGNDRIINGTVDIGAYEAPASFLSIDTLIEAMCFGENSGAVGFTYDGQSPFDVEWDNEVATGTTTDSLSAGNYSLTITDANECTEVIEFEITQPNSMQTSFVANEVTCPEGNDGSANLTIQGGIPDYFIAWSSGEFGYEATLLSGGWHEVTIVDGNNCELIDSVFIEEPEPIFIYGDITNASTSGSSDGAIEIFNVTGGTPPFHFEWNTGESTALIENLSPNSYTVTITDANGCIAIHGFLVSFNTGVEDADKPKINVVPNPVRCNSYLNVEFESVNFPLKIELFNPLGMLVQSEVLINEIRYHKLNMPAVPGVYCFSIRNGSTVVYIQKIVVY